MAERQTILVHLDVKQVDDSPDFLVESSIDGGPWSTRYVLTETVGDPPGETRRRAEDTARVFAAGCRFAGACTRITSGGYTLESDR
jgi:hypothetical protein